MKAKNRLKVAILILFAITGIVIFRSRTKLTYLEFKCENEVSNKYITIENNEVIEQEFTSQYDMIHGIGVKIGTFQRDNNSMWKVSLIRCSDNAILYSKIYNASLIKDNSFHLFEFDKNIQVEKNKKYIVCLEPTKVNQNNNIAFFVGNNSSVKNASINGEQQEGALCFSVYGGNYDVWWIGFILLLFTIVAFVILRSNKCEFNIEKMKKDRIIGGIILFVIVFSLLFSFSTAGNFTDEWDNIRGGLIIAKGGVLYKDYVTQHTPVMYYLCAVFAKLGAKSLEQFRLLYYLFEAIIWAGLYIRHSETLGRKKIYILAAIECVVTSSVVIDGRGVMILSDSMQGICMIALLLEYYGYCHDKKLNWNRSIIIALVVWGSIGVAFISVYALLVVFICVLIIETMQYKGGKVYIIELFKRYCSLIICLLLPLIVAVVYFKVNGSLKRAFEQFYLFNRDVYSQYIGIGDNVFEPFVLSVQNYLGLTVNAIGSVITGTITNLVTIQFIIMLVATIICIVMIKKKQYMETVCHFGVMLLLSSRGYREHHGLAAFYVAIMIISLFGEELWASCRGGVAKWAFVVIGAYSCSLYVLNVTSNLLLKQQPISELESRVVSETKDDEEILIDTYYCDSIYFCYKNRYPANRACYMLAWYMDWYEQDTIDDLNEKKPRIVVYNPDITVWRYKDYSYAFYEELKKNYRQMSQNKKDCRYTIWIREE